MKVYEDLVELLNKATKAYDEGNPIMTDAQWDKLYWEIVRLEQNYVSPIPTSPTQKINYDVVNELQKVTHSSPMLSLDKTKNIEDLETFKKDKVCFLSLKMDGLTCRLTYQDGRLVRAETRGNGIIGEDITHNARVIKNIPTQLKVPADLVIDGEVICTYKDFEPFSQEYKNPRNFAAGSLRLLDANECAKRNLSFISWHVVEGMENDNCHTHTDKLLNLTSYGRFCYVPFEYVAPHSPITQNLINHMIDIAKEKSYPIDGLVLKYDSIEYGVSLGATAHHYRNGIAYKFYDDVYPTVLRDIEWSMGRRGVLTPVAVFDAVDIDGTEVSRANMFNVSVMHETLGIPYRGQPIEIYKANQIIPQIFSAVKKESVSHEEHIENPSHCPYCGSETRMDASTNAYLLYCSNYSCPAKLNNKLEHFCGKKGLDIKGLSTATLDKLIEWGWVEEFADIFDLRHHYAEWIEKPGFGKASVGKILDSIEYAQYNSTHESFISAIGIPLIGRAMVKELMKNGITTYYVLYNLVQQGQDFSQFNGFGYEKSESLLKFDYTEANKAYALMNLISPEPEEKKEKNLEGATIVITGTLHNYKNRAELQAVIEAAGGKVVNSVSKNTTYLINNDIESNSAKNQTAKRLGVPIITEEKFLKMI